MQLGNQISLTEAETIFVSLGPVPEEGFEHQKRGLWFEWEAGAEVRALQDGSSQCCSFGCWRAGRYQDTCWPFLPLRFPFFFLPHLIITFCPLSLCTLSAVQADSDPWVSSCATCLAFSFLHPPSTVPTGWPNACLWNSNKCISWEHRWRKRMRRKTGSFFILPHWTG